MQAEVGKTETGLVRESLQRLLQTALEDFPEPHHAARIRDYVTELCDLMAPAVQEQTAGAGRARATRDATGDHELTLLCKLEDYLEAILVERASGRGHG